MGLEDLVKIFESFPANIGLCLTLEGRKWSLKMMSWGLDKSYCYLSLLSATPKAVLAQSIIHTINVGH